MQTNLYDPKLHLMVDDVELQSRRGVERVLGKPRKLGPVVRQDRPWEEAWVYAWGSVVHNRDAGRLEMFYETAGLGDQHCLTRTCRAVSYDGLNWDKPAVGQYAMKGAADTNIVTLVVGKRNDPQKKAALLKAAGVRYLGKGTPLHDVVDHYDGTNVVRDENEPDPNKRYKYLVCMWTPEHSDEETFTGSKIVFDHYLMTSPDGIHWDNKPQRVLNNVVNDGTKLEWDARRKLWMLTGLNNDHHEDGTHIRVPVMTQSTDLHQWDPVHRPFELDEGDDGGRLLQGHFHQAFLYGNQYVGFFSAIHTLEGWCQSYLLSSRDGGAWERPLRGQPFIQTGNDQEFDADSAEAAISGPVLVGDDLIIYYCGRSRRHYEPMSGATGMIGAVTLKRDRFAGLAHGGWFNRACDNNVSRDAEVLTVPVEVTGPTLYVNARSRFPVSSDKTADWGAIAAELLDESGKPIPGYTMADAQHAWGDAVRIPMRWRERGDVSELVGRKVAVRFRINRATLYAYIFDR